jgi:tetratricopeptide (TPR) repeat protein
VNVTSDATRNFEILKQMGEAYDRKDCDTVVRVGAPLFDAPGGTGLSEKLEAMGYELLVSCEWQKDKAVEAAAHALRGTRLEQSSDWLWRARFGIQLDSKQYEAAAETLEAMSQGRGAALNSVRPNFVWQLLRELKSAGKADVRLRLLRLLASDSYAPDDLLGSNEGFRQDYAEALAEKGDMAGARSAFAGITNASILAQSSLNPRLRTLVPAGLDIRAAAESTLAADREAMARHSDRLDALINVARDLRQLGRPKEAVDLLLAAGPRLEGNGEFSDLDEMRNWYWDALGRSYHKLGRYDEMVDAFRKGAGAGESGIPNVSQVINLAEAQNSFGRGEDALRTLAVFADGRKSSPYGEMEMRFARGCAQAVAGRPAEAAADVVFARAHDKDHPEALSDLLLCLGDMDGAAAAFIVRLDDPDRRTDALMQLSDYDDPPVVLALDPVDSRLPALKARPDVKAAIERAGGVRRFRLQRGEL